MRQPEKRPKCRSWGKAKHRKKTGQKDKKETLTLTKTNLEGG